MVDEEVRKPKIGEGHAQAMFRQGFHEIAQILPAFPDSNVRVIEEQGVAGNNPPAVVTSQMGYSRMREEYAGRAARDPEKEKGQER
jgi:hypothetical protein